MIKGFVWKLLRNGLILTALYFLSIWSTQEINLDTIKTLSIFLGTYIFVELAHYYDVYNRKNRGKTLIL